MPGGVSGQSAPAVRRKRSPSTTIHPTIGPKGKEMRALDLPMAILLHLLLGIVGLSLMGMAAFILCVGAIGATLSGTGSGTAA